MTPSRFSAVGLPDGPNMRIRLFGDRPSAAPSFSKPIVALMHERNAAPPPPDYRRAKAASPHGAIPAEIWRRGAPAPAPSHESFSSGASLVHFFDPDRMVQLT